MLRAEKLKEIAGLPSPVLSVYLNTRSQDASRHPQAGASLAWLKKEADAISKTLPYRNCEEFLKELRRIERFLQDRHPEEKALAIFAGPTTWNVLHLQTAVENEVAWGRSAIGQMFRLYSEHKSCCVVVIDHHRARFFAYSLGELTELATKQFAVDPSQWKENAGHAEGSRIQKVRGSHPDHFERRLETQYSRLCREAAEEAAALSKLYDLNHIFVAGPDRLIEPIRSHIPSISEGTVSFVFEDLGNFSPEELLRRLEPIITEYEQARQMTTVTRLLNSEKGVVANIDETLAQVQEGSVRSIVISRDFDFELRQCKKCGLASRAADPVCPVCAGERQKVTFRELVHDLLTTYDTEVEFVSGEAAKILEQAGGIGGWLRQAKVAVAVLSRRLNATAVSPHIAHELLGKGA